MGNNITAQFRDYLLQCEGRTEEIATVDVDWSEFFILMESGDYILMETGDKIIYEEQIDNTATLVINAQHRDYLLTAQQVDRD